jgi:hypothetical protein
MMERTFLRVMNGPVWRIAERGLIAWMDIVRDGNDITRRMIEDFAPRRLRYNGKNHSRRAVTSSYTGHLFFFG